MKKTRLKQLLYGIELRSTAIIANGLVHRVPKRIVLSQIKSDLLVSNKYIHLSDSEINHLWTDLTNRYIKISKKTFSSLRKTDSNYKENLEVRQNVVYSELRKSVLGQMERDKNELADIVESRIKHSDLYHPVTGLLSKSRNSDSYSPFFVCDSHPKPAKDHVGEEGKCYIDEDWEQYIDDDETKSHIRAYVKNHNIQTVQYITGEPIFLTTRKNCRHRLHNIPIDEILHSSIKTVIRNNNLYLPDILSESYEKTQYRHYYERLKALQYLNGMCPSEELAKDIKDARKLTVKWANRAKANRK